MTTIPVLGDGIVGPVFRVLSVVDPPGPGSAAQDFLAILPAATSAARPRRPQLTIFDGWGYGRVTAGPVCAMPGA